MLEPEIPVVVVEFGRKGGDVASLHAVVIESPPFATKLGDEVIRSGVDDGDERVVVLYA